MSRIPPITLIPKDADKTEFVAQWQAAVWLTDPIKKRLQQQVKYRIKALLRFRNDGVTDAALKGEIRALETMIDLLPGD